MVTGPDPRALIDPVTPEDLRQAMREILRSWLEPMLTQPTPFRQRGYQSYTVLSICRIMYTLEFGRIVSKPVAVDWVEETLGKRWIPLIERALEGRQHPQCKPQTDDVIGTLDFARFAVERDR